jgi:FkbM family methyltransferase
MSEVFERNLIYDVGMHQGEDSEFYLKKGFRVVAIEAAAALAQAASKRFQEYIENGQLVILNVAIAEEDGPLTFFENPGMSIWGTTDPQWAERNRKLGQRSVETTVQGRNFANILSEYGVPYYLKIDIEGADTLCLEGLRTLRAKPKHVSIESTKTSWKSLMDEFALFKELGYTRFKAIPQHTVNTQVCPRPAKEGVYVDHSFKFGSSGLFGEELDGDWMDEAQILRVYRRIFLQYRLYGDDSLAARLWRTLRPKSLPAEGEKIHSAEESSSGQEAGGLAKRPSLLRRIRPRVGWYDTHATTP